MTVRQRVIVLYGGQSTEHEISCRSAAFVLRGLDRSRYEVLPVGIDRRGVWHPGATDPDPGSLPDIIPVPAGEPPAGAVAVLQRLFPVIAGSPASGDGEPPPVVFPVLHGSGGEDGRLQGLLELAGIPCVGADCLASALCMDKEVTKVLVQAAGVPVVPWVTLRSGPWQTDRDGAIARVEDTLPGPVFVKPATLGSSVGITRARDRAGLIAAVDEAFRFDEKVLVEEAMDIREIEYAALGGYEPELTGAGECHPKKGFYTYEAKYLDEGAADVIIPADLTPEKNEEGRQLCGRIYRALQLHGMARIDLFLTRDDEKFYMNEVNTIPGFTSISQYPMLWQEAGLDGPRLLDRLIDTALGRSRDRAGLVRVYDG